jgi:hypothetical protein
MGIFSSVFSGGLREPPKERWGDIITNIHAGLAASRPKFFDLCVETAKGTPGVPIRNTTMSRDIELYITVCQLHLGRVLIASRRYVSPENGSVFVTMMYSDASRYGSILKRNEAMVRYFKEDDEDGLKKIVFCSDLTKFITGDEPAIVALTMVSRVEFLRLSSWLAVAHAFGDADTVKRLAGPDS